MQLSLCSPKGPRGTVPSPPRPLPSLLCSVLGSSAPSASGAHSVEGRQPCKHLCESPQMPGLVRRGLRRRRKSLNPQTEPRGAGSSVFQTRQHLSSHCRLVLSCIISTPSKKCARPACSSCITEENPSFSGTKRLASDLLEDWFLNYGSRVLNRFKHCCPSHHTRFITNIRDFQRWKFWGWVKSHGRKSGDERQPHPGRCGQGETPASWSEASCDFPGDPRGRTASPRAQRHGPSPP